MNDEEPALDLPRPPKAKALVGSMAASLHSHLMSLLAERRVLLMGVLNATPDSFFDGGRYASASAQRQRVEELVAEGAEIIDIGGESSRPGSTAVPAAEQIARMEVALHHAVAQPGILVSVDTTNPEVAAYALKQGAHIINDVSCLADAELAAVIARYERLLVLMHSRGPMSQMAGFSIYPPRAYSDVVADVTHEWLQAAQRAERAGLARAQILFDPGIGFAKNAAQSWELLRRLPEFTRLKAPMVVGASRKSFLTAVEKVPPTERLGASLAAALHAAAQGAGILRVHDVRATRQALRVVEQLTSPPAAGRHDV